MTEAPTDPTDFAARTHALLASHGGHLLGLAKASIEHSWAHGADRVMDLELSTQPPELAAQGACFVTLNRHDRLRGCIGSPEAWRPLALDVVANANRAAFHDPRFPPLKSPEIEGLTLHLSVLSPAQPFPVNDQADLLAQLTPGTDGLIIKDQGRGALFLPSVWAQLPDPAQFLAHLKAKAGLPVDHWSADFHAWRFIAPETHGAWGDISTRA